MSASHGRRRTVDPVLAMVHASSADMPTTLTPKNVWATAPEQPGDPRGHVHEDPGEHRVLQHLLAGAGLEQVGERPVGQPARGVQDRDVGVAEVHVALGRAPAVGQAVPLGQPPHRVDQQPDHDRHPDRGPPRPPQAGVPTHGAAEQRQGRARDRIGLRGNHVGARLGAVHARQGTGADHWPAGLDARWRHVRGLAAVGCRGRRLRRRWARASAAPGSEARASAAPASGSVGRRRRRRGLRSWAPAVGVAGGVDDPTTGRRVLRRHEVDDRRALEGALHERRPHPRREAAAVELRHAPGARTGRPPCRSVRTCRSSPRRPAAARTRRTMPTCTRRWSRSCQRPGAPGLAPGRPCHW